MDKYDNIEARHCTLNSDNYFSKTVALNLLSPSLENPDVSPAETDPRRWAGCLTSTNRRCSSAVALAFAFASAFAFAFASAMAMTSPWAVADAAALLWWLRGY